MNKTESMADVCHWGFMQLNEQVDINVVDLSEVTIHYSDVRPRSGDYMIISGYEEVYRWNFDPPNLERCFCWSWEWASPSGIFYAWIEVPCE